MKILKLFGSNKNWILLQPSRDHSDRLIIDNGIISGTIFDLTSVVLDIEQTKELRDWLNTFIEENES